MHWYYHDPRNDGSVGAVYRRGETGSDMMRWDWATSAWVFDFDLVRKLIDGGSDLVRVDATEAQRLVASRATARFQTRDYNPDQPRDDSGKFASGGGGGGSSSGFPSSLAKLGIKERKQAFKALSQAEQDRVSNATVTIQRRATELLSGLPGRPSTGTPQAAVAERIAQYKTEGLIAPDVETTMAQFGSHIADALTAAGVPEDLARKMTLDAADAVAAQEVETMGRTLGDHGVRHVEGDIRMADALLAQMPGITAQDRAISAVIGTYHDMGYLTPTAQNFIDGDHGHWSAQDFDAHLRPDLEAAFGVEATNLIRDTIDNHQSADLDWTGRPVASAITLADNLALFHKEKLPALFDYVPKNTGVLIDYARGDLDDSQARERLHANIDARPGLSATVRERLHVAAEELNPTLPTKTVGMLGAEVSSIRWNGDHPSVTLKRNPSLDAVQKVLDMGQAQFEKAVSTYGGSLSDLVDDNRLTIAQRGKNVLEFVLVGAPKRMVAAWDRAVREAGWTRFASDKVRLLSELRHEVGRLAESLDA